MEKMRKIVVATRPSKLAYDQTMQTVELLKKAHPNIEFEVIKYSTKGDRDQKRSLTQFGGTGLFVKELENALYSKEADIAIHSLKDVPSAQPEGLVLAAFPQREDPRDVLMMGSINSLTDLPMNAILGTGSPRRVLQLSLLVQKAEFKEIRGNIDTRLSKLERGDYDAIVLAAAGMNRLNIPYSSTHVLEVDQMIPAIGQGAIAIECRTEDKEIVEILRAINHKETEQEVLAERAFMKEVEGGCKFPLAAHAKVVLGKMNFKAIIGDLSTMECISYSFESAVEDGISEAILLAQKMKQECKEKGIVFEI